MTEAITINATYKTNAHKFTLVNIVGTSGASSIRATNRLQTFAIAAAFVNGETEEVYTWILSETRDAIWPEGSNYTLPSVMVTDNKTALRNAIDVVFPEVQHLLCSWHLWNTMETKLLIASVTLEEYRLRKLEAELLFKAAMSTHSETTFNQKIVEF